MNEPVKLQLLSAEFKVLLVKYSEEKDWDADRLLRWLNPLFDSIEAGDVSHRPYEFSNALGYEPEFFERHPDVKDAQTKFVAELEDWKNKEWFKMFTQRDQ